MPSVPVFWAELAASKAVTGEIYVRSISEDFREGLA